MGYRKLSLKTEDDDKEEEAGVVATVIRFIYQVHNNFAVWRVDYSADAENVRQEIKYRAFFD